MDRTSASNYADIGGGKRGFRDRNLGTGTRGTTHAAADRNALQEELLAVIEEGGLTPNAAVWTQLRDALRILYGGGGVSDFSGYRHLPGGLIMQWGNFGGTTGALSAGVAEASSIAVTFPITFPITCWHVFAIAFDVSGGALQETAWRSGTATTSGCSFGLSCRLALAAMSGSFFAIGR